MRLYGLVKKVEIKKFTAYDPKTGAPDPGYILQATVEDADEPNGYPLQCSFNEGFGLENLKEARKNKAPEAERDAIAAQVETAAKQMEGQQVLLVLGKPRAKGFVTFPVSSIGAAQPA